MPPAIDPMPELADYPLVMQVSQVSEALRYDEGTVRALAGKGTLEAFKIGRLWRFRRTVVETVMAAGLPPGGAPYPATSPEVAPYPDVMTVPEVANVLVLSENAVRGYAGSGELPAFRAGKSGDWRFLRRAISLRMRTSGLPAA